MKLLKQFISLLNMRISLSTKVKTHYEILGVSPTATHNEIKSAYYKLTLKYHPDKNKSESAKYMFQKISDAYAVVGNYHERKQYDRTIAVRHGKVHMIYKPLYKKDDPTHNSPQIHKIYDFDQWTREHYQRTFENDLRKKRKKKLLDDFKQELGHSYDPVDSYKMFVVATILITMCFGIYLGVKEEYDNSTNKEEK